MTCAGAAMYPSGSRPRMILAAWLVPALPLPRVLRSVRDFARKERPLRAVRHRRVPRPPRPLCVRVAGNACAWSNRNPDQRRSSRLDPRRLTSRRRVSARQKPRFMAYRATSAAETQAGEADTRMRRAQAIRADRCFGNHFTSAYQLPLAPPPPLLPPPKGLSAIGALTCGIVATERAAGPAASDITTTSSRPATRVMSDSTGMDRRM